MSHIALGNEIVDESDDFEVIGEREIVPNNEFEVLSEHEIIGEREIVPDNDFEVLSDHEVLSEPDHDASSDYTPDTPRPRPRSHADERCPDCPHLHFSAVKPILAGEWRLGDSRKTYSQAQLQLAMGIDSALQQELFETLENHLGAPPVALPSCAANPFVDDYHSGKKARICDGLSTIAFSERVTTAVRGNPEVSVTGYFLYLTYLQAKARMSRRETKTRQKAPVAATAEKRVPNPDILKRLMESETAIAQLAATVKSEAEQQKAVNQTLFAATSQIQVVNTKVEVVTSKVDVVNTKVDVVNTKLEGVHEEMTVLKADVNTKLELVTNNVDVITNNVIDLQKEHTRAIDRVGTGIERMLEHLNLSYREN